MEIFEQPQKAPRAVELTKIEQTPKIPETVEADIFRQLQKIQEIVEANASRQAEPIKETKNPREDRIVLLTDGIFAIALTLLVLSIPIPSVTTANEFNAALTTDFFPTTLSYLITFAVLVAYWLGHRHLMNLIERIDLRFIEINLVFLAFVAFFPVTNGLLKDSQFPVAVIIYTAVLAGCGYSSALLWIYALGNHRLIAADANIRAPKYSIINALIYPTFFLLSLLLLLIPGMLSSHLFYAWLILPFIDIIYNRAVKSMDKTAVS